MYTTQGKISIRTIYGAKGPFSVGVLVLDIGEFVVKDKRLDQFDDGDYEGSFTVAKIGPNCYHSAGRLVIEVKAVLAAFDIETQEPAAGDLAIPVAEPDDDEEEAESVPESSPAEPEPEEPTPPAPEADDGDDRAGDASAVDDHADAELFGALWPQIRDAKPGDSVKLDTTVTRAKFRAQTARIGKTGLGWTFVAQSQSWIKH